MLKCYASEKRGAKDSSEAKDSLLKVILDSRLGSRLVEPLDHSTLFRVCFGNSIFAEHHFFHRHYLVNRVVKGSSHWVNVLYDLLGTQRTFDSSGERSILSSSEKDFYIMNRAHSYTLCDSCTKTQSASSWKGKDKNIVQTGDDIVAYLTEK